MVLVAGALSVGLAVGLVAPALNVRFMAPGLDLVLDTLATLVALSVAVLALVRYRQQGAPVALFEASAFLVLAIANGLHVSLVVTGLDTSAGMGLSAPGQEMLYVFTGAQLLAASLLVRGGIASLGDRRPRLSWLIVVGPIMAIVVVIVAVMVEVAPLPPLAVAAGPGAVPQATVLGAALQVSVAGLFLWAAALSRRLYLRYGSSGHAWLAVGLVFGAFAQAWTVISPSIYTGLVTTPDFLRLAFDLCLLVGIQAEMASTLADLRAANSDLERLRTVEVQRAALEERAHLSRELHDGLAQNLWLAKLKAGRLTSVVDLPAEAAVLADELGTAIDAGLAEAQQAVTALRVAGESAGPMWEVITRYVEDFSDRFGMRAEVDCPTGSSGLAPRAEAELVRIAQEALSNIRRHADATFVRVRGAVANGRLELFVGDNGCGFDPTAHSDSGYGLTSMRERAIRIGGELHVDSHPQDGTRISVLVPVPAGGS